ncbi:MAG: hypothetical protein LBK99_08655 [Opitutaceae bacterium]|nr:hypothetical protein [Opitutaceae bacterium]
MPGRNADGIISEHGKYSAAYMSDWATLPTADKHPRRPLPPLSSLQPVKGETLRRAWLHEKNVRLADLELAVTWENHADPASATGTKQNAAGNQTKSPHATTLFRITNADEVVVENITLLQADADYRAYNTILIEGADRVVIRNVRLAGTVASFHLRIEGCRDVFIDNLEIAGLDYHGHGRPRVGGGLWLNNGNTGRLGINGTGLWTEYARQPGWQVIQNSYFHDGIESDGGEWRNQDAVLIHHPGHGVLFNNVVENWFHPPMDGGFDIAFRRADPELQGKFFRIERNILRNVTLIKTPAAAPGPNTLFYANNLFINTRLADYHKGAANEVRYIHNTYVYDLAKAPPPLRQLARRGASGYACLWNYGATTRLENSLLYRPDADVPFTLYSANKDAAPDKYLHFKPANNTYALDTQKLAWLRTARDGIKCSTLGDWRGLTGADAGSVLVTPPTVRFANYENDDFRLRAIPAATAASDYLSPADKRMKIDRDFHGQPRNRAVTAPGAFCAIPAAP